ncbi:cation transporter [Paraburkholderia sp.]|uniref:cation diffusion facilitator family transporter n=1 Tax=Paraburkholderia sp. TaxID=1926495 RepID=UPI00239CF7F3|nr:cation transporter [Paraburkholderia sp.]MDE1181685.1 cation transporter [Paraburkholderia sp.]
MPLPADCATRSASVHSADPVPSRGRFLKAASASAALNAALMTLQLAVALTVGSDALLADGLHTFGDLAGDGVVLAVLFVGTLAQSRATGWTRNAGSGRDRRGHDAPESIAQLVVGGLLIATAIELFWRCIAEPAAIGGGTTTQASALGVAVFVAIAKEILFRFLRAEGRRTGSSLIEASAWHARVDAISACVAMLGIAGSMAGLTLLDHVASAMIGVLILRMGYQTVRRASKEWKTSRRLRQPGASTARRERGEGLSSPIGNTSGR